MRTKRDLRMLCLVCSTLRTLAVPNLYRSVDIPVEDAVLSPKHIKCFLAVQNHGVRFIRHLRIRGDWSKPEAAKLLRSPQRMRQVNVIMLLLLQRTAQNQLQSFEWLLPSSMSPDVMHQLQAHHSSLRKVSWKHEATLKGLYTDPMRLPQLACLSAQNVVTADQMDHVQRWITSCTELRKLEISTLWIPGPHPNEARRGKELDSPVQRFFSGVIERSKRRMHGSKVNVICGSPEPVRRSSPASELSIMSSEDGGVGLDDISSITKRTEVVDPHHPPDNRLQLDSLKLTDFPFLHSASQLPSAINLSRLSSLTLQACQQTSCFLDSWRVSSSSAINLKKLHLLLPTPHEGDPPAPHSATSFNRFLGAFTGLRSLVLLSRVHSRYPMNELEQHSLTLERLVLDLKVTDRSRLCLKLNRLASLYRSYHRLTELAVAVIFSRTIFAQLGLLAKQLTTLRILNAGPNNDPRSPLADATTVATAAVAAAAAPLRMLCMACNDPDQTATHDKWHGQKLHVFYVQRVVNILGGGVPVLTRISMEKAEELQGGRVKVLKTEWEKWT